MRGARFLQALSYAHHGEKIQQDLLTRHPHPEPGSASQREKEVLLRDLLNPWGLSLCSEAIAALHRLEDGET